MFSFFLAYKEGRTEKGKEREGQGTGAQLTMSDDDATDLILRHGPMQDQAERHQHPRQIRRRENEQAEEAQPGLRIPPAPNVDQGARQGGSEEGYAEHGGEGQQEGGSVDEEPGEESGRATG